MMFRLREFVREGKVGRAGKVVWNWESLGSSSRVWGLHIPSRTGDQRIVHFALVTRMRGLGPDSPHGCKWAHA